MNALPISLRQFASVHQLVDDRRRLGDVSVGFASDHRLHRKLADLVLFHHVTEPIPSRRLAPDFVDRCDGQFAGQIRIEAVASSLRCVISIVLSRTQAKVRWFATRRVIAGMKHIGLLPTNGELGEQQRRHFKFVRQHDAVNANGATAISDNAVASRVLSALPLKTPAFRPIGTGLDSGGDGIQAHFALPLLVYAQSYAKRAYKSNRFLRFIFATQRQDFAG